MWFDTMVSAFSSSLHEEDQDRGLFRNVRFVP